MQASAKVGVESRVFAGCRVAAALTIAAAIVIEIFTLFVGGAAPHTVLVAVAASPVGMSAFVIFALVATPDERTLVFRLVLAVVAIVFATLYAVGFSAMEAAGVAGACIPGTVFAYLIYRIARTTGRERAATIDLLAATSIIGVAALSMIFFLDLSTKYFNPIFDAEYVRIDELFGVQPSAAVALFFDAVRPLMFVCLAVYFLLPMAQGVCAAVEARNPDKHPGLGILPGFIIAAVLGYIFYALMPAVGPAVYLAPDFPMLNIGVDQLAGRSNIDLEEGHLRGAMPSLHITWAALVYLASRRMHPYLRIAAAIFLALTFLATLGLGMHYLIDLIVAVPLILAVRAISATDLSWRGHRSVSVAVGLAFLLVWVWITRAGIDIEANRVLLLVVIAATVAVPWFFNWMLDRARSIQLPQRLVSIPA